MNNEVQDDIVDMPLGTLFDKIIQRDDVTAMEFSGNSESNAECQGGYIDTLDFLDMISRGAIVYFPDADNAICMKYATGD